MPVSINLTDLRSEVILLASPGKVRPPLLTCRSLNLGSAWRGRMRVDEASNAIDSPHTPTSSILTLREHGERYSTSSPRPCDDPDQILHCLCCAVAFRGLLVCHIFSFLAPDGLRYPLQSLHFRLRLVKLILLLVSGPETHCSLYCPITPSKSRIKRLRFEQYSIIRHSILEALVGRHPYV